MLVRRQLPSRLREFFAWLLAIQSMDEDVRRRGRTIVILCLLLIPAVLLAAPVPVLVQNDLVGSTVLGFVPCVLAVLIWLARSGRVQSAASILIGAYALLFSLTALGTGMLNTEPFFLSLMVVTAGMVLRPAGVVIAILLCFTIIGLLSQAVDPTIQIGLTFEQSVVYGMVLAGLNSLYALISSATSRSTVQQLAAARTQAEQAVVSLEQVNASLEERIAERTRELSASLESLQVNSAALQQALAEQRRLSDQLAEVSVPVIPIRSDALIVPLVGTVDSVRTGDLFARVLGQVEQRGTAYLMLDITGVAVIDTTMAVTLVELSRAVKLLGGHTMIVGIRPEVAQSLVSLGIDLSSLSTAATLQQAVEQLPPVHRRYGMASTLFSGDQPL
jgi:rsbT co-antagonist protein RsbR